MKNLSTSVQDRKVLNASFKSLPKVRSFILTSAAELINKDVCRILRESKKDSELFKAIDANCYRTANGSYSFTIVYNLVSFASDKNGFDASKAREHYTAVIASKLEAVQNRIKKLEAKISTIDPEKLKRLNASIERAKAEKARIEAL